MKKLGKTFAAGLFMTLLSGAAMAAYPERPITLIHGFGAGGNADSVARVLAAGLEKQLGQTVVVEPKTGAGGTIASNFVSKAAPDGYTLIMLTGGHTASAAVKKELPYDPVNDFSMISTVSRFPFVIAVKADHPAKDLGQLLDSARMSSKGVTYSSVGAGSTQHLTGELLAATSSTDMLHVPYRGGGAPVMAVLSGDVDVLIDTGTVAAPQLEAGALRALAVTSKEPWPLLPGAPTVQQTLPGYEVMSWLGLAGPAGLSEEKVEKLNTAVKAVLADPEVQAALNKMGSEPWYSSPNEMRTMVDDTIQQWKQVVTKAGIPLQ